MSDPIPFADDELVFVDRTNCAHALDPITEPGADPVRYQWLCDLGHRYSSWWVRALGQMIQAQNREAAGGRPAFLRWREIRPGAGRAYGSWPCQTCVGRTRERDAAARVSS